MSGASHRSADVLIVTRRGDFHATVVADGLRRRGLGAAILETDRLGEGGFHWSVGEHGVAVVPDRDGVPVAVAGGSVVWWRRLNGSAKASDHVDPEAHDLIARDTRATLLGAIATEFDGRFVSDPEATRAAENKLVQLRAARRAGFTVPDTIVSSDPAEIRGFWSRHHGGVVVKTLCGSPGRAFMTGRLREEHLIDKAMVLSPAIYQEFVPGERHLRINVFGDRTVGAMLTTDRLDWRYPLDCTIEPYQVPDTLARRLSDVLTILRLRMGIFDLKLLDDDVVWLEVNSQGQFLWLDGLCGLDVGECFVDFLVDEVAWRGVEATPTPT